MPSIEDLKVAIGDLEDTQDGIQRRLPNLATKSCQIELLAKSNIAAISHIANFSRKPIDALNFIGPDYRSLRRRSLGRTQGNALSSE